MNSRYFIQISGRHPKSFLRFLSKLHIELLSIQEKKENIIIEVDEKNYQEIQKMKTSYSLKVVNRKGWAQILFCIRKYYLFFCAILLSGLVLFLLSHLTFEVEVIHTKAEIRELVKEELALHGIDRLKWKVSFDRQEQIVKEILEKHKDQIEWLEIENIGTKYIAKVEERKLNEEKEEKKPQDIVAKKDGILLKIDATSGTVVKKKNDYVKKGDIIITGVIKNQETLMKLVPAEGTVYAETWYQSTVEMPLQYKESFLTGNQKEVIQISFLNHKLSLFDFHPFKKSKDKIETIVFHPLIPFRIQKAKQQELRVIDEIYTREEATTKAMELAKEKLKKRLSVNDQIIFQKTLKIVEKDSKIIVDVFFKVSEDITDTQKIDETSFPEEIEQR